MYQGFCEEGDHCPKCHGLLSFPDVEGCSCHINPPCSACVNNRLTCSACGWEDDAPEYKDIAMVLPTDDGPGLSMREYRPRKLDTTKIDYRTKTHTHFTQIQEGVYPEGTAAAEVAAVVRGTFGGRFESFGNGKFKYIAYTD